MAAIVLQAGSTLDPVAVIPLLKRACRTSPCRASSKFVDTLPATENGKIQKYKLRERGITEQTWDREAAGITVRRR